ncbi:hypothetical protein B0H13DRAFT_1711292 [Mycena leptocephala]|nr:hypothetical protein B0H13DRAFT_1711292 [Mycena leptocephala]
MEVIWLCGSCHRVAYCGAECQKGDWLGHRPICNAFAKLPKDVHASQSSESNSFPLDPTVLHRIAADHGAAMLSHCQRFLERQVTSTERDFIGWTPRCTVCAHTEQSLGIEKNKARSLLPCPKCDLSFCCSPAHWAAANDRHTRPTDNDRSQCKINEEVKEDGAFERIAGRFLWVPARVRSAWISVARSSWTEEFWPELERALGRRPLGARLRAASDSLTTAMSILYGLEILNKDDNTWTRKSDLRIHVCLANLVDDSIVFEEILHRLPELERLKIVLCGPEMCGGGRSPRTKVVQCCQLCSTRGRGQIHQYVSDTYHSFVERQGRSFDTPDLCIAFNSAAAQDCKSWRPTLEVLLQRKIPSIFTADNFEDANADSAALTGAGASLHSELGVVRNPWGSVKLIPRQNNVFGFSASNQWIAGAFS